MALRSLSLCAGIGGIDLGLERLGAARTVCYVERDPFAVQCLVGNMRRGMLDDAPVWDDLCAFEGREWCGRVDLVVSGLPCQPYSLAGKRRGNDDERALWPEFVRVVRESEPAVVFLENVPAFLNHAEPLFDALRALGFEWAPPLFVTASHVGAIHRRKRIFLLAAHAARLGHERSWAAWNRWDRPEDCDMLFANTDGAELRHEPRRGSGSNRTREAEPRDAREGAPDAHDNGLESEWCGWVFDRERQTFRHDPDRCNLRCRIAGSAWSVESPVCRVDAGTPGRPRQLRALGNAVVPQVAALAFSELWQRIHERP